MQIRPALSARGLHAHARQCNLWGHLHLTAKYRAVQGRSQLQRRIRIHKRWGAVLLLPDLAAHTQRRALDWRQPRHCARHGHGCLDFQHGRRGEWRVHIRDIFDQADLYRPFAVQMHHSGNDPGDLSLWIRALKRHCRRRCLAAHIRVLPADELFFNHPSVWSCVGRHACQSDPRQCDRPRHGDMRIRHGNRAGCGAVIGNRNCGHLHLARRIRSCRSSHLAQQCRLHQGVHLPVLCSFDLFPDIRARDRQNHHWNRRHGIPQCPRTEMPHRNRGRPGRVSLPRACRLHHPSVWKHPCWRPAELPRAQHLPCHRSGSRIVFQTRHRRNRRRV
eukprot:comp22498_c0_seq1/m.56045 comp22498_c0_seq1/g.56045  ORF comp22498_c0_seq1/g.56045 comp22498_c0_seq1/m.56045 type:complete len:332 (-) comp22498_c0_seq1:2881-3876(-)